MIKLGAICVVKKEDKILISQRISASFTENAVFGLPSGHVEEGEHAIEAGIRELLEETNLKATSYELLTVIDDPNSQPSGHHFIHFAILVNQFEGELKNPEPDKHTDWQWVGINNLPQPLLRSHLEALNNLDKGLSFSQL